MKIRKSFVAVLAALVSMPGISETATVDGLLWQYSVSEGKATIEKLLTPGVENVVVPGEVGGFKVTKIGSRAFEENSVIETVEISEGLSVVDRYAFYRCRKLVDAKLPGTLKRIEESAFYSCNLSYIRLPAGLEYVGYLAFVERDSRNVFITVEGSAVSVDSSAFLSDVVPVVEFLEHVPQGMLNAIPFKNQYSGSSDKASIFYPRKYAAEWSVVVPPEKFAGYVLENKCKMSVTSKMRENVPTIMDVKVMPVSTKSEVKIRPVAFLNGINSFANIVKVKTFADGTESVVRNPVKANQESAFSWNVAADLTDKVAKLKMDVMCVEDEVVPLELVSIPASTGHAEMTISRNVLASTCVRDALMWLMADPSKNLRVSIGDCVDWFRDFALIRGEEKVCKTSVQDSLDSTGSLISRGVFDLQLCEEMSVKRFVLEELGYTILEGDDLEYARKMTGLKLENGPYVKMK